MSCNDQVRKRPRLFALAGCARPLARLVRSAAKNKKDARDSARISAVKELVAVSIRITVV